MRQSRILFTTIILISALVLIVFITASYLLASPSSYPDGFYVYNFDSQIADMKIVNGDREYFAVVKNSRGQLAIIDLKVLE